MKMKIDLTDVNFNSGSVGIDKNVEVKLNVRDDDTHEITLIMTKGTYSLFCVGKDHIGYGYQKDVREDLPS